MVASVPRRACWKQCRRDRASVLSDFTPAQTWKDLQRVVFHSAWVLTKKDRMLVGPDDRRGGNQVRREGR